VPDGDISQILLAFLLTEHGSSVGSFRQSCPDTTNFTVISQKEIYELLLARQLLRSFYIERRRI
jgi:hypothetical protein